MRDLLNPFVDGQLGLLVTLCFVVFFVVMTVYVYRRERKALYQELSKFPLKEDL